MTHFHMMEEDDLYSGYDTPTLNDEDLENDVAFQQAVQSVPGRRRPMTAKRPGTTTGAGRLGTSSGSRKATPTSRPMTGAGQNGAFGDLPDHRPMTAITAAGYTSSSTFDPLGQSRGPAPPLEEQNTPEEKLRLLEKEVKDLLEESAIAQSKGASQLALIKAKEAGRKERVLARKREQSDDMEKTSLTLKFSVLLNLASQYENNELYPEALKTYRAIVKGKMFENASRMRVNMGNICFKQKQYPEALKFYKMALDQTSSAHNRIRMKIVQNIGMVLIKMGRYSDAITSYEDVMSQSPNVHAGFNLIICYCAIGDTEMMKQAFQQLISVPLNISDEDENIPYDDDADSNIAEPFKKDKLHQMEKELKIQAETYVMSAAKLIAPAIEASLAAGLDWCVDMVKTSRYHELASDLETNKAINFLNQNDFNQAEEILKSCVRKDSRGKSAAATDLSALYFLKKDYDQADRYANIAMSADHYNAAALTNKGNTLLDKDPEKAAAFYMEALMTDSCCTEALYNLGLAHKKMNRLQEALDCFLKLHAIVRNCTEVMFQLADLHERQGDPQQAIEWLKKVISITPTDPNVLAELGRLYDDEGDKSQAFQCYNESFRCLPTNIKVIEWLAAYYIDQRFYERAINYLERAILVQPSQIKWQLLVASCYRRCGNYQEALETYQFIHNNFPENVECLRFLLRLCEDMRLNEAGEYATKLKKLEKRKKIREQREESGGEGRLSRSGSVDCGHNGASTQRERLRASIRSIPGSNEPYEASSPKQLDASYVDPLGPQVERPKTGTRKHVHSFEDVELGDDLLPQ